jgi:integrase
MAPRRRSEKRRNFPDNLYESGGYYSWKHPKTGKHFGLGRDRKYAFEEAIKANATVGDTRPSLVERITGAVNTWGDWCTEFEKKLAERESAANTNRTRKSQMNRLRKCFDESLAASKITTKDCADVLEGLKKEGKRRTAQAFRSFLIDCFDRMIAAGWRPDNPAAVTDEIKVKVNRARLPFVVFMRVYKQTEYRWLRNAMALSLVSGQGREECAYAEFSDVNDGCWWSERGKTGARIILPLELRLERFGMSLDDVVRQCRTTGIVSKFLVHQTERAKGAKLGKKMHVAKLTRQFSAEIRALNMDWEGKKHPTFHEIRSLSSRLYKEQGNVNPQELLGHKDPRTTAIYTDGRGEWVRVGIKK